MLNKLFIIFILLPLNSYGFHKYVFSGEIRNLRINSESDSLFIFKSPVIASVCQPSNLIEFNPVSNADELAYSIKTMKMTSKIQEEQYALFLKASPLKNKGLAQCGFHLQSGEKISINLVLDKDIVRPILEVTSVWDKANDKSVRIKANNTLEVMKYLLNGGRIKGFVDLSSATNKNIIKTTKSFNYKLKEALGDNKSVTTFRFEVTARKKLGKMPNLKNSAIGKYFYSAWMNKNNSRGKEDINVSEVANFYVLARVGTTIEEVLSDLP